MRFACVLSLALSAVFFLTAPARALSPKLRLPLLCEAGSGCRSYSYIDHDTTSATKDWKCGHFTYAGHDGTDFLAYAGTDVVAVAPGTVVSVSTGFVDGQNNDLPGCSSDGLGFGNYVYVDHGGYRALYAHLENGTVAVQPGNTLSCGQKLGRVGATGCVMGIHLHLELRPAGSPVSNEAAREVYDPFGGAQCSPWGSSWVGTQDGPGGEPLPTQDCAPTEPETPGNTCGRVPAQRWICASNSERHTCQGGSVVSETCSRGCTLLNGDAICVGGSTQTPNIQTCSGSDCAPGSPQSTGGAAAGCALASRPTPSAHTPLGFLMLALYLVSRRRSSGG